jgi:hypothetical protein
MSASQQSHPARDHLAADGVRDPLASRDALLAARQRPMSERLELALSWNAVAAELRAGIQLATEDPNPSR